MMVEVHRRVLTCCSRGGGGGGGSFIAFALGHLGRLCGCYWARAVLQHHAAVIPQDGLLRAQARMCVCVSVCARVHQFVCTRARMCVCMCAGVSVCACVCANLCMHPACLHVHLCIFANSCTRALPPFQWQLHVQALTWGGAPGGAPGGGLYVIAASASLTVAGLSLVGASALKVRLTSVERPACRWPTQGEKVRLGWVVGQRKRKCLEADCARVEPAFPSMGMRVGVGMLRRARAHVRTMGIEVGQGVQVGMRSIKVCGLICVPYFLPRAYRPETSVGHTLTGRKATGSSEPSVRTPQTHPQDSPRPLFITILPKHMHTHTRVFSNTRDMSYAKSTPMYVHTQGRARNCTHTYTHTHTRT